MAGVGLDDLMCEASDDGVCLRTGRPERTGRAETKTLPHLAFRFRRRTSRHDGDVAPSQDCSIGNLSGQEPPIQVWPPMSTRRRRMGWSTGFEPATARSTIWGSNQAELRPPGSANKLSFCLYDVKFSRGVLPVL
jgi:hypothetical protein